MTDDPSLGFLKEKITSLLDFDCSQYTNTFLGRRIETRLRATGIADYRQYAALLASDQGERSRLLKELTIHITHFFRDIPVWDLFRKDVLPLLAKLRREAGESRIKIWSAGCSTGEEPISIAICLYEALGPKLKGFDVSIVAFDRDMQTVEKAHEAQYEEEQFHECPAVYKDRYFTKDEDGHLVPVDDIRKLIDYRVADIISIPKPKDLDIIFCRNTVIYFDRATKERLYTEFFDALKLNGFLVMGKTETLFGPARDRFQFFDNRERIFCKE